MSARAKLAAGLTGVPPQPRSVSSRAQLAATLTGVPPDQPPHGARAKLAANGRNPAFEHWEKNRASPRPVPGIPDLVGQLVQLPDGRAIRVLGLDVLQPDTEHHYAGAHSYGCAADATFVAQRLRPSTRFRPTPFRPLSRPTHAAVADATNVARRDTREVRPRPPEPVLTRQQEAAAQIAATEKNWNGAGALIEGYGLINKSITPVNNSAFRVAQRVNRLAGKKVITPSHFASGAAQAVRTVAPANIVRLGGKLGKFAGPLGMGLTGINILVEMKHGKADAHTAINGVMLVVTGGILYAGATGLAVAASPVVAAVGAVIVVYGILDFTFDIGEKVIDPAIGRKSDLWD